MRTTMYIILVCQLAIVGRVHEVRAQPSDNKAIAQKLFKDARTLMKSGHYEEASEKLEASLELDVSPGYVLNLAVCYEKMEKWASAWARYREAADLAKKHGSSRQRAFAEKSAAKLESLVPHLTIEVPHQDDMPELVVQRDGQIVPSSALGIRLPIDPGRYEITAAAPGFQSYTTEVDVRESQDLVIEIPKLVPEPQEGEPAAETGSKSSVDTAEAAERSGPGKTRRIIAISTMALGGASIITGLGFGLSAKSAWDGAFEDGLCDRETLVCSPEGQARTESVRSRGLAANVLVGVGLAAALTGVVLYVTAPEGAEREGVAVVPVVRPDGIGLTFSRAF